MSNTIEKDTFKILEQRGIIKGLSKSAKTINKELKTLLNSAKKEKEVAENQHFHLDNQVGDFVDSQKREANLKVDFCNQNFLLISVLESKIKEENAKLFKMKEEFKNQYGLKSLQKLEAQLQTIGNEKHRKSKENYKKENEINKSLMEIAKILSSKRLFEIVKFNSIFSELKEKLIVISKFKELAIKQKGNNNENNIIRYLITNNKDFFIETAKLFVDLFVADPTINDYKKLERYFVIVQNNLNNI